MTWDPHSGSVMWCDAWFGLICMCVFMRVYVCLLICLFVRFHPCLCLSMIVSFVQCRHIHVCCDRFVLWCTSSLVHNKFCVLAIINSQQHGLSCVTSDLHVLRCFALVEWICTSVFCTNFANWKPQTLLKKLCHIILYCVCPQTFFHCAGASIVVGEKL